MRTFPIVLCPMNFISHSNNIHFIVFSVWAKIICSKQNKRMLVQNGYFYGQCRKNKCSETWRCLYGCKMQSKCKAVAYTFTANGSSFVKFTGTHNHKPSQNNQP